MDIQLNPKMNAGLKNDSPEKKNEQVAMAFEKIFARELVQEMTKGLFKSDDNKSMMGAGNGMYRQHIVDTLSQELASQHKLGMGDMIKDYLDQHENLTDNLKP